MRVETVRWTAVDGWAQRLPELDGPTTLVLVLVGPLSDLASLPLAEVHERYPSSVVTGCTTAGAVDADAVLDDGLLLVVCRFERTRPVLRSEPLTMERSHAVGQLLGSRLRAEGDDLAAVLVLSDGMAVVGNALAEGLVAGAPGVPVFGGMSALLPGADGTIHAPSSLLDGELRQGVAVVVGLFGEHVTLTTGTGAGWDELGPERQVTRSSGASLFEVDGQPALDLYRRYLGEEAAALPGSGLRFPILVRRPGEQQSALVRSVRSIDEESHSIGLTGDIPEGSTVQLLHQNSEAMAAAAEDAARAASAGAGPDDPGADGALALVVSCLGRRLALGSRTEDELEAVRAGLPPATPAVGFYTYGELAPTAARSCDLHNQTMTVGVVTEWTW